MHIGCGQVFCKSGCVCPVGSVLDDFGRCILETECPCHHNGKSYKTDDVIRRDCNTCTCVRNTWECTKKRCRATCTAFGDPHYKTFDGRLYSFQGGCNYVMSTDKCPGSKLTLQSFRIDAENIPCGSAGVTCTKSVTVTLHDTIIHMVRGKAVPSVTKVSSLSPVHARYELVYAGLYVIIKAPFGLNVIWDRGTRLYIELSPDSQHWSKVCGLCGNFDGDMTNDYMAKNGITETSPYPFGDTWRARGDCTKTMEPIHPCKQNKHRESKSHAACAIIKSGTFKPCHISVDPDPYYERCRCVYDTCGCDSVGDCECTCEAIAAYAYECLAAGVVVKWRQDKCGK
ncbi:predicted protein [Nematostella vectensis]|uniref:VWFD domain-containing protein n=1 Tax=Nematostella vectensis TaxID=45351 RepID=A7S313_NEMVE|nr:predicted protein [Nematostella vectensis]|eukprot:XP_001633940.1 predicted protein [Nematostella vectensis]